MAKRNLAELVGQAVASRGGPAAGSGTTEAREYRTTEVPELGTTNLPEFGTTEVAKLAPKYLQLVRKDTRLRDDQLASLTGLARQLSRRKRGSGKERITENTLIRVAVDLLLNRADKLAGETEDELLASVGEAETAARASGALPPKPPG